MTPGAPPLWPADLDLASAAGVRAALATFGLRLRPSRGQHVLVNRRILDRILDASQVGPQDVVLDVGAGIGTLTVALAKAGAHVVAVEVDPRLIPLLRAACGPYPGVRIILADIMDLPATALPAALTKIVANLPYSIASPLLIRLLEERIGRRFVVMVQNDVAKRIVAAPGSKTYGLLSVAVQAYAEAKIVTRVPRSAFIPPPQVTSAVIRLDVRDQPVLPHAQMPVLMDVARAAFGQRRKMLRTALRRLRDERLAADAVEAWCRAAGIDPRRRGESLAVEEFARLARARGQGMRPAPGNTP